ncbi:MAG: Uncharacterized protein AUK63_1975 [bacterium P3]|nr:MAG: Uncharacterized protein AUK63_1975 [bacterium P3]KWW34441.1 MAG: Uncharacterized protein F083_2472 [bacterium F083]
MAKKKITNEANSMSLAESFLESTGQSTKRVDVESSGRGDSNQSAASKDYSWERFAFICDRSLVAKVKAIATKESVTIRDLMEYMMSQGIARYEKKNGAIDTGIEVPDKKRLKDIM